MSIHLQQIVRGSPAVLGMTFVAALSFFFLGDVASAQTFVPLADVDGSKLQGLYSGPDGDLAVYLGRVFYFVLSIGAILAVLRIAWGGYLYMTTDLWSTKERAREVLRETVLGLLLLLAVWLILDQINPNILKLNTLEILQQNPAPITPNSSYGTGSPNQTGATLPPGGEWCVAGGGGCYATQAECQASRGFLSPQCLYFTP